jgi:hypothetical protein
MHAKRGPAGRLREVRVELHGEHGGPALARCLGLPRRTRASYEDGITIPGEVLLAFVVATVAEPQWLLHGEGPMFQHLCRGDLFATLTINNCPPLAATPSLMRGDDSLPGRGHPATPPRSPVDPWSPPLNGAQFACETESLHRHAPSRPTSACCRAGYVPWSGTGNRLTCRHASGARRAPLGPSGSSATPTTVGGCAYGLFPGAASSPSASVGPTWELLQETAASLRGE